MIVALCAGPALATARRGGGTKRSGRPGRVQTGLDVLEAQKFAPLRNKHVGLITNHTGLDSQGRSTVDLFSPPPEAPPPAPPPRAERTPPGTIVSGALIPSSSMCKTLACVSTPTPPPWATAWKK